MKRAIGAPGERAPGILRILSKSYPSAGCELSFSTPLELVVATILSAQCTDARVNLVTPALFAKYRSAEDFAAADRPELEALIRSTGFYKNKAKSISGCCAKLASEFGGEVPEEMDALVGLPGVGRKTANLVRAYAFGKPGIICDTHVLRVSKRLALTSSDDPDRVEGDLAALVPKRSWTRFSTVIMWHGRRCCTARAPACGSCPVSALCPGRQKTA